MENPNIVYWGKHQVDLRKNEPIQRQIIENIRVVPLDAMPQSLLSVMTNHRNPGEFTEKGAQQTKTHITNLENDISKVQTWGKPDMLGVRKITAYWIVDHTNNKAWDFLSLWEGNLQDSGIPPVLPLIVPRDRAIGPHVQRRSESLAFLQPPSKIKQSKFKIPHVIIDILTDMHEAGHTFQHHHPASLGDQRSPTGAYLEAKVNDAKAKAQKIKNKFIKVEAPEGEDTFQGMTTRYAERNTDSFLWLLTRELKKHGVDILRGMNVKEMIQFFHDALESHQRVITKKGELHPDSIPVGPSERKSYRATILNKRLDTETFIRNALRAARERYQVQPEEISGQFNNLKQIAARPRTIDGEIEYILEEKEKEWSREYQQRERVLQELIRFGKNTHQKPLLTKGHDQLLYMDTLHPGTIVRLSAEEYGTRIYQFYVIETNGKKPIAYKLELPSSHKATEAAFSANDISYLQDSKIPMWKKLPKATIAFDRTRRDFGVYPSMDTFQPEPAIFRFKKPTKFKIDVMT